MLYVALTLGLFGSLHCVGMCGPLALAFSGVEQTSSRFDAFLKALAYNIGRTVTYTVLGVLFGVVSTFFAVTSLQKSICILLGILLIGTFLFSMDLDRSLNKLPIFQRFYRTVQRKIAQLYKSSQRYPTIVLGMANGLLPCGLVYLAISGAIASGNTITGIAFMACFGAGTIPMLVLLTLGYSTIGQNMRKYFRKILPYVTLGFGIFLIYRGLSVSLPTELNFWEALKNPVMCH